MNLPQDNKSSCEREVSLAQGNNYPGVVLVDHLVCSRDFFLVRSLAKKRAV